MRTDGRQENDRVLWVTKRAASRQIIGRRARWRCYANAVSLDSCEVLIVTKDLDS